MNREGSYNPLLTISVLALLCVGIVMVYSASAVYAGKSHGASEYFLKRQFIYTVAGILAMIIGRYIDYRVYKKLVYWVMFLAAAMLAAVLIPGVGMKINHASRWLKIGPVAFQPAEFVKLAFIMYMAHSLVMKQERIKTFKIGFLPHIIILGIFAVLLLRQPDLGTVVILTLIMFVMLFVAGGKVSYIIGLMVPAALVGAVLVLGSEYRRNRILAFLNPLENRRTVGYQIYESLISVGSGGLYGLGLGEGRQKLFFLPAAHTDFVFAIIAEEFGLIGVCAMIVLFAVFAFAGTRIAMKASDKFGMFLAFGITAGISLQALVNMAVVVGLVPTKGLTLPFVSYGGSSVVVTMFGVGILQSIYARRMQPNAALRAAEEDGKPQRAMSGAMVASLRRAVSRGKRRARR